MGCGKRRAHGPGTWTEGPGPGPQKWRGPWPGSGLAPIFGTKARPVPWVHSFPKYLYVSCRIFFFLEWGGGILGWSGLAPISARCVLIRVSLWQESHCKWCKLPSPQDPCLLPPHKSVQLFLGSSHFKLLPT